MAELEARTSLGAGAIAAFLASLCCLGPLALLALGIGGAWVGYLTALSTYQPIFAGLTLVFLALAFRKVYLVPQACEPGKQCDPRIARRQRVMFWTVGPLVLVLLAAPWAAGYLL